MQKIKQIFKKVFIYGQRKYQQHKFVVIFSCLFLILVVYLIIALISVKNFELTLARLRASIGGACHEECRQLRQDWRSELAINIQSGHQKLEQIIFAIILDKEETIELKDELLQVLASVYQNKKPPQYLLDYLTNKQLTPEVQVLIFNYFFIGLENTVVDFNYYFSILDGSFDNSLKLAVIQAISNTKNQASYFTDNQILLINKLLQSSQNTARLKQALILLLGDYMPWFPERTAQILLLVNDSPQMSKVSKFLAVDILNRRLGAERIPYPLITDQEWADYYINVSDN